MPATADPDARAALEAALGHAAVSRIEPLGAAPGHRVLGVRLADGTRAVLKLAEPGCALGAARTAAVLGLARDAGIPVPAVLAAGPGAGGREVLLLEHLEGVPWRDVRPAPSGDELDAVQRDLAAVVLALRRIRFPSFGELDEAGRPAGRDAVAALAARAERIRDAADRATFTELLRREAGLFADPAPPVLVHDDLHPGNLLLASTAAGRRLAGVLDWDKAWAGPADSDVARLAFWDGMTGPAFWAAVGEPPLDPAATRRRLVHQLLWALEHGDPSPRHRADTDALRVRLGVA